MKNTSKGFSLIEMVVVVAIILIIAAIAIPSMVQARSSANESAAVADMQTINVAMTSYVSTYPDVGYAANLNALGGTSCEPADSTSACLIDTVLAAGQKDGYTFTMTSTGTPADQYLAVAVPTSGTGNKSFCSTETSGVHFDATGAAISDHDACLALPEVQ